MRLTPLRSVDTHLPRWPNTVQEQSRVVIWIYVSAGDKRRHTHMRTHTHAKLVNYSRKGKHTQTEPHEEKENLTGCRSP